MIRLRNWGDSMYLSRVELSSVRRSTMAALAAPQKLHGAVEAAFPGERRRRLWRVDRLNGKLWLLVLSEDKPNLHGIAEQFGVPGMPRSETKDYMPLLERVTCGSVWRFRLTANPTKSCSDGSEKRGTVHAHCTPEYQKQWLLERAEKHGFSLDPHAFTVTHTRWYHFHKGGGGRPVSLLSVTYEGILHVTDADMFRQVLSDGLGRGKAYGLGLLTVMRVGGAEGAAHGG